MILEYAQLLSTAVRISGIDAGYKATHINHPCSIWTRASLANWLWLRDLTGALHSEWQYRGGHTHSHKSYIVVSGLPEPLIEDVGLTPHALCMPEEYKCEDVVEAYRNYYRGSKQHIHAWKKRPTPVWVNES